MRVGRQISLIASTTMIYRVEAVSEWFKKEDSDRYGVGPLSMQISGLSNLKESRQQDL